VPVLKGVLQPEGAVVEVQVSWSAGQARQLRQAHRPVPPALDARALVDTGAEITCVDGLLIQHLGLPLAQLALANVPALGGLRVGTHYHAGVVLVHPSGSSLAVPNLLIMEVPFAGLGYQALLGRDVLARCDFLYGGRRQRFALRY
jgi:hypothetical protein